jgi:hypothetical protein
MRRGNVARYAAMIALALLHCHSRADAIHPAMGRVLLADRRRKLAGQSDDTGRESSACKHGDGKLGWPVRFGLGVSAGRGTPIFGSSTLSRSHHNAFGRQVIDARVRCCPASALHLHGFILRLSIRRSESPPHIRPVAISGQFASKRDLYSEFAGHAPEPFSSSLTGALTLIVARHGRVTSEDWVFCRVSSTSTLALTYR